VNKRVNLLSIVTLFIIAAEHFTLGKFLKRHELARRAIGIATILSMARALVPFEHWFSVFSLFVAAGVGLIGSVIVENAIQERTRIKNLKRQYHADQTP